ncbi:MAG: electron transport complex subunit RsxB [Gammaproteobacteria bacterium]|nr:electron transport complex subunit RsxB [Gammaproteobacteria bacterium]
MTYPLVDWLSIQALLWLLGLSTLILQGLKIWRWLGQQREQQRSVVDRVNYLLPQTQCGQCGYPGCLPYAREICRGESINKCPPGGTKTIVRLAELLNRVASPLSPAHGQFKPLALAVIREAECVGCTKCIQACPVDAIIGGPNLMHTVIEKECTGCDLCVESCPVDCIDMLGTSSVATFEWALPSTVNGSYRRLDSAL